MNKMKITILLAVSFIVAGCGSKTVVETDNSLKNSTVEVEIEKNVSSSNEQENVKKLDMSDINNQWAKGDFSEKGNLAVINNTQYRVLDVNETQVKVLAMESIDESLFNEEIVRITFGEFTGLQYANSTLDLTMTNYYNSLPETIQNAIIEQNINQSMYGICDESLCYASYSKEKEPDFALEDQIGYYLYFQKYKEVKVGKRKIYALDIDDILAYFGPATTSNDLIEMLYNSNDSVSNGIWLRSVPDYLNDAYLVDGKQGWIQPMGNSYSHEVRPTFVVDLSLLSE